MQNFSADSFPETAVNEPKRGLLKSIKSTLTASATGAVDEIKKECTPKLPNWPHSTQILNLAKYFVFVPYSPAFTRPGNEY